MFKKIVKWFKDLLGPKKVQRVKKEVQKAEDVFAGWIKDELDTRDQVFGEKK